MRFSTRARYGLRICFLIGISQNECVPLSSIVKQTDLSEKYLEQILVKLKKGGILKSTRGVSGGYMLSKPKEEISINEILIALDDNFEIADCAIGTCSDLYCPNKKIFSRLFSSINQILDNFTLSDMIEEYKCI